MFASTFFDTTLHSIDRGDENSVTWHAVRPGTGFGMSIAFLMLVEEGILRGKSGKARDRAGSSLMSS
jgi:hypothetical protein